MLYTARCVTLFCNFVLCKVGHEPRTIDWKSTWETGFFNFRLRFPLLARTFESKFYTASCTSWEDEERPNGSDWPAIWTARSLMWLQKQVTKVRRFVHHAHLPCHSKRHNRLSALCSDWSGCSQIFRKDSTREPSSKGLRNSIEILQDGAQTGTCGIGVGRCLHGLLWML